MLSHLPRYVPAYAALLADIGNPPPAQVARALGVSTRTAERWAAAGAAPRAAALALWQLTRWGVDAHTHGAARRLVLAESLVLALRVELLAQRRAVTHLEGLAEFGSANAPRFAAG